MLAFLMAFAAQEVIAQPSVITTISFGSSRAGVITANPVTNKVYAAQEDVPAIAVIDGVTHTILTTIPTAGFHTGIDVDPGANKVYVSQQFASSVRIIDGATDTVITDLPVFCGPIGAPAVNPNTDKLYVICPNSNSVAVFDTGANSLRTTIPVGTTPVGIAVNTGTNRVYITNRISSSVTVIDSLSDTVITTIPLADPPSASVVVNPATNRIYFNTAGGNITVFDGATNTVAGTIPGPGLVGVDVNPSTNRVYVGSDALIKLLLVVDGTTNIVVDSLSGFFGSENIAVIPNTGRVYVANGVEDHSVSVIEDLVTPFAAFSAKAEIHLGPFANDDAFEVKAPFTLGSGNDGIDPLAEDVSFKVGTFSTTLPAGSFTQDKKGRFKFEGVVNGVTLQAVIQPLGGGNFEFKAQGQGADLTGTVNPVTVGLTIGDDSGSATVTAEFQ